MPGELCSLLLACLIGLTASARSARTDVLGDTEFFSDGGTELLSDAQQHVIPEDGVTNEWIEEGFSASRGEKVILPVMGLLLVVCIFKVFYNGLHAAFGGGEPEPATTRQTNDPLVTKRHTETAVAVSIKNQLHTQRSIPEQLDATFTVRRILVLTCAVALAMASGHLISGREFAVKKEAATVHNLQDCVQKCRATERSLCGGGDVSFSKTCSFKVVPEGWKVDFTLISLIFGISLIIEGIESEVVLIGLGALYASLNIITSKQALAGFSNGSVVALTFLFPIASAIDETGLLDTVVQLMLGNPSSLYGALFRMMLPVAVLSAFLANTAIVSMMIPIIVSWSRRLGVGAGQLLMPLSFAAQLGGTTTLVGSSICLVAKESVNPNDYNMRFFDLAPAGTCIAVVTFGSIALCLRFLSSSAAPEGERSPTADSGAKAYSVAMLVDRTCSFQGSLCAEVITQLSRLPGIVSVDIQGGKITPDTVIKCSCADAGITALRYVRGLRFSNENDLRKLGSRRRRRNLYEVAVRPESKLVKTQIDADLMRHVLGCCPVALRGGKDVESKIEAGDIILVEADQSFVDQPQWSDEFSVTRKISNSSPPRIGGVHDGARAVCVCSGMLLLISLVTIDYVSLAIGGAVLVLFLILIQSRSLEDIYGSIKVPVLLTIAGAFGISAALQETGMANVAAAQVVGIGMPLGKHGVRAALYFIAMFLSMFMNNSATVAILGPMTAGIAAQTGQTVQCLLFVVIFGAGTCLITPLGYQTNMMVMDEGKYTFTDFVRFGTPIQLLHMVATLVVCGLMY